jgi:hypothetical protein
MQHGIALPAAPPAPAPNAAVAKPEAPKATSRHKPVAGHTGAKAKKR